jgi:hypothetical protein
MRLLSEYDRWLCRCRISGHTGAFRTPANPPALTRLMPLTPQPTRPTPMQPDERPLVPPPPPSFDDYRIIVHAPNLNRFVLRRWWATATCGVMKMGYAGGGIWQARSKEKLVAKVERSLLRDARSRGKRTAFIQVVDESQRQ